MRLLSEQGSETRDKWPANLGLNGVRRISWKYKNPAYQDLSARQQTSILKFKEIKDIRSWKKIMVINLVKTKRDTVGQRSTSDIFNSSVAGLVSQELQPDIAVGVETLLRLKKLNQILWGLQYSIVGHLHRQWEKE